MAPNKQVSPAFRILRGEGDASARATHLEAATRKFLVATNERKQMSSTTNFKRIALVAVAALGMGLLSSAPSQAAFSGTAGAQLTVTVAGGTGTLTGTKSDSTTAGTVSVVGLALAASDSYTVTSSIKSVPATTTIANAPALLFMAKDTATSTGATIQQGAQYTGTTAWGTSSSAPSAITAGFGVTESNTTVSATAGSANTYVNASWRAFQESTTAKERKAGTYTYTLIVTPNTVALGAGTAQVVDITITIAALATDAETASPAFSTMFVGTSTSSNTADEAVSALAEASATAVGGITVNLRNISNGTGASESVTITTTLGTVGDSTVRGRSVVLKYTGSSTTYSIFPDGTAGTATISVSTPSVTFSNKTVSFYAKSAKTITATVATPLLGVGANAGAVRGVAVDANGNAWTGTAYIVASSAADALIAGSTTPVSCGAYDAANARHNCPITAAAAGTAKFKIIDASTVALATATSNEVTVTVSVATMASVKIEFDKATYAPNERARIYITPLDSTGKAMQSATYASVLAVGGISVNGQLSYVGSTTTADSLTAVTGFTTAAQTSAATGARAGSMQYTVYMPVSGGTVTLTATGGTALPVALRTAGGITASATVTDSGAAALAAVNALATTVASLRTLITTLTNLVLKIQKKVKA
jgi:hypothetical protein